MPIKQNSPSQQYRTCVVTYYYIFYALFLRDNKSPHRKIDATPGRRIHRFANLGQLVMMRLLAVSAHNEQVAVLQIDFGFLLAVASVVKKEASGSAPGEAENGRALAIGRFVVGVFANCVGNFVPILQHRIVQFVTVVTTITIPDKTVDPVNQLLNEGIILDRPCGVGCATVRIRQSPRGRPPLFGHRLAKELEQVAFVRM